MYDLRGFSTASMPTSNQKSSLSALKRGGVGEPQSHSADSARSGDISGQKTRLPQAGAGTSSPEQPKTPASAPVPQPKPVSQSSTPFDSPGQTSQAAVAPKQGQQSSGGQNCFSK